jgi:hypothetical protein
MDKPIIIHRSKLEQLLLTTRGKIFNVCWTKKDGTERCANARLGVTKHIKGTGMPPSLKHSYISIYLMWTMDGHTFEAERGYRNLNLDTITSVRLHGVECVVTPIPIAQHIDLTTTTQPIPNNVIAMSA